MTDADLRKVAAVTATLTGDLSGVELEINRELVVSTGHLPSENFIDTHSTFASEKLEHGWRVYAVQDLTNYPEEMHTIIQLAKDNGCKWVVYDADGSELPGVRIWSWR